MINPYQKPLMMPTNPAPQGLPLEWVQMPGEDPQQGQDMSALGGGLASLLRRFKKPGGGATDAPMPDFMGGGGRGGAFA